MGLHPFRHWRQQHPFLPGFFTWMIVDRFARGCAQTWFSCKETQPRIFLPPGRSSPYGKKECPSNASRVSRTASGALTSQPADQQLALVDQLRREVRVQQNK